jgi:tRNA threonylcarbamoyladenosine biosynthesis protein TsaE
MHQLPRRKQVDDEAGTAAFAAKVAAVVKAGDVIILSGGLGAGKTAFARSFIRFLTNHADEEVPSPTFTLAQTYDTPKFTLWHFDLYRLKDPDQDILELGWDEARRGGVALIEWGQRLQRLLPKDRLEIALNTLPGSDQARQIDCIPFGTWNNRMEKK